MEPSRKSYISFLKKTTTIELNSIRKDIAIREMVENTPEIKEELYEEIIKLLKQREDSGSTVVMPSVALAHVESSLIDKLIISFGFSKRGIDDWDKENFLGKVNTIILIIFPKKGERKTYMDIIKQFIGKLADEKYILKLSNVKCAHDIKWALINN